MRQRIDNVFSVTVKGVDLTTVSNIEFYIRQGSFFYQCIPVVLDESTMTVLLPKEKADSLTVGKAQLQFAFTNADGNSMASAVLLVSVGELIKESGYSVN